ncbi:PPOX class probable F420-dependent enzyme [Thermocatellispora tengchongensis]|uniref:PPOX class probable F420-dependent enzyme n=1 Tax=Thermocatellispora tengchongensis TaxID=1073253 RepID=A0A840PEA5_9ACTN|nr:PPOX class F420-dependent oxidoreductase [Thermocatellispora tengchongensis]MBB5135477.1 PPOX class probable F420-dependent enzyme [Thermocatellispora tengchongensis]
MGTNRRAQVEMSADEVRQFVAASRTASLATLGPAGHPHLVAMWYAIVGGRVWFETKAKSQKAVNLRREPRASVLIEDGLTYDTLRGVSLEGRAVLVEDRTALWAVGVSMWERYFGPYTEEARPEVEAMIGNRVAVRFDVQRIRSWDHRKLGLPPASPGGSTAQAGPVRLNSQGGL